MQLYGINPHMDTGLDQTINQELITSTTKQLQSLKNCTMWALKQRL